MNIRKSSRTLGNILILPVSHLGKGALSLNCNCKVRYSCYGNVGSSVSLPYEYRKYCRAIQKRDRNKLELNLAVATCLGMFIILLRRDHRGYTTT